VLPYLLLFFSSSLLKITIEKILFSFLIDCSPIPSPITFIPCEIPYSALTLAQPTKLYSQNSPTLFASMRIEVDSLLFNVAIAMGNGFRYMFIKNYSYFSFRSMCSCAPSSHILSSPCLRSNLKSQHPKHPK